MAVKSILIDAERTFVTLKITFKLETGSVGQLLKNFIIKFYHLVLPMLVVIQKI